MKFLNKSLIYNAPTPRSFIKEVSLNQIQNRIQRFYVNRSFPFTSDARMYTCVVRIVKPVLLKTVCDKIQVRQKATTTNPPQKNSIK